MDAMISTGRCVNWGEKEEKFDCAYPTSYQSQESELERILSKREKRSFCFNTSVSPYHPRHDQVKFFGYLAVFEDYFIHSDMYLMDADSDRFLQMEPISTEDAHTSGCIRVPQEELDWLAEAGGILRECVGKHFPVCDDARLRRRGHLFRMDEE